MSEARTIGNAKSPTVHNARRKSDSPESNTDKNRTGTLLLVDLFKHSWDLFLKTNGVCFFACSLFVGYGVANMANLAVQIFSSLALLFAAIVSMRGNSLAIDWARRFVVLLSDQASIDNLLMPSFDAHIKLIELFGTVSKTLIVAGALYFIHAVLMVAFGADILVRSLSEISNVSS